jgi:CheY-like chemotaxis protein
MKVLLVEDEPTLREGMAELVGELAQVREAATVAEALEALHAERFVLVLTDLRIAGSERGGRDILQAARQRLQPVTIVSAAAAEEVALTLRPYEPDAVLSKPFQLEEMLGAVERFLALCRDVQALAQARALPAEAAWSEVAPGVSVAQAGPHGEATCRWVRMQPGASVPWQSIHRGPQGLFVVEGDIEVEGESRSASHYFFLSSGPHETRTRQGCLLVSLTHRV